MKIDNNHLQALKDEALQYIGGTIHNELQRQRYHAYLDCLVAQHERQGSAQGVGRHLRPVDATEQALSGQGAPTWLRDGSLVYTLEHDGYRKGFEQFRNRLMVNVTGDHRSVSEDERAALAERIRQFLNNPEGVELLARLAQLEDENRGLRAGEYLAKQLAKQTQQKSLRQLYSALRGWAEAVEPSDTLPANAYIRSMGEHKKVFDAKALELTGMTMNQLSAQVVADANQGQPKLQPVLESGRVDCPSCGEGLAWDDSWTGTGSACKVCGYSGEQNLS